MNRWNPLALLILIRSNFWFVPTVLVALSLLGAVGSVNLDETNLGQSLSEWLPFPQTGIEGARLVVSTVAGSMITIASLVFSLTLVALTLVSQQLGPRILPIFMTDTPTQFVLGAFVSTFVFSLIVLASIGTGSKGEFVPQLSVYCVCLLAILSFGLMIYFIHHIARSIQADSVIRMLAATLTDQVDRILLAEVEPEPERGVPAQGDDEPLCVPATSSGYIQIIDYEAALDLATEHDVRIRYLLGPGHFVVDGTDMIEISGASGGDDLEDDVAGTITLGPKRTPAQQVEYEFNAILEVALRALSPGLNDPLTAMTCIDHLSDALARVAKGPLKPFHIADKAGRVRVLRYPQDFEHYMDQVIHPLRQASLRVPQVARHLASALEALRQVCSGSEAHRVIAHHAKLLAADCRAHIENDTDRREILDRLDRAAMSAG